MLCYVGKALPIKAHTADLIPRVLGLRILVLWDVVRLGGRVMRCIRLVERDLMLDRALRILEPRLGNMHPTWKCHVGFNMFAARAISTVIAIRFRIPSISMDVGVRRRAKQSLRLSRVSIPSSRFISRIPKVLELELPQVLLHQQAEITNKVLLKPLLLKQATAKVP